MGKGFLNTLGFIYWKLDEKNVKWVLAGSSSLYVQGISIKKVNDIDILTTKEGAFEANNIFKEFEVKPVEYSENGSISAYRGIFKIDGIDLDVSGEYSHKIKNKWVDIAKKSLATHVKINLLNMRIPVIRLENHLEIYKELNRKKDTKKIELIEEALKQQKHL